MDMERVISLFQRPEDFEFSPAGEEEQLFELAPGGEPEYFQQLMKYLREQKHELVREGAD
ncbi:MAG TPA: hypothetical protein VF669_20605 [Tepidisphaeraceae bacterium]